MFLAINVGNSRVVCGLFRGKRLVRTWATKTNTLTITVCHRLFESVDGDIRGIGVASVVPRLNHMLARVLKKRFSVPHFFVNHRTAGVKTAGKKPHTIGADRLANVVAGFSHYRRALIIVDCGTAITLNCVSARGKFLGGVITPGVETARDALVLATAKLPKVALKKPRCVMGKDTQTHIQSGILYGYAGLIDRLVTLLAKEMKTKPTVIATGGHAHLLAPLARTIQKVHPYLTLEGIRFISEKRFV